MKQRETTTLNGIGSIRILKSHNKDIKSRSAMFTSQQRRPLVIGYDKMRINK